MKNLTIAIDGPAGAGKSTVAKNIAAKLGILYLDTGAMYRAYALKALRLQLDPADPSAAESFLDSTQIGVELAADGMRVILDGEDVSKEIRRHELSRAASDISKHIAVRKKLVEQQQKIAEGIDVVMDGRDIGSYVLPNATVKFYLDASPDVRAQRRFAELQEKGQTLSYDQVLSDIVSRDENDKNRSYAPLTRVPDAVYVDSSLLSREEVVSLMISLIQERAK